jgi:F-type H+-transporting ATPase subunit b
VTLQPLQIFANTEEAGGIAALGIDPLAIVAQAVTFLLLFFVIKKFALEKIINTLEERRKTIDKGVHLGIKMQEEKQKFDEEADKILQSARKEADKIIAGGHQEAGEIIKEAENVATRKTDAMLVDAQAKIDDQIKKARVQLEQDVLSLVAEASSVVLREKVDAKKDAAILERAIKEVETR